MSDSRKRIHPITMENRELLRQGRISRREFLRLATWLGASVPAAYVLAACAPRSEPETGGGEAAEVAATAAPTATSAAAETTMTGPVRGGTLRIATKAQPVEHPAALSWGSPAQILRNVAEYLTWTGSDGLTRPHLLESWEASDDAKTWTLNLHPGIMFNHGKELTADDIIFNIEQWLDDDVGSSMKSLLGGYLTASDVEKVDDYTVILHASRPEIAVPQHLFHYPALIMPSDFEGDWLRQPYGTGPFQLVEYLVEERAIAERREGYWRNGADGQPLPYLDRVEHITLGDERSAIIAAMESGQIHTMSETAADDFLALHDDERFDTTSKITAQTAVFRARADVEPFTDPLVRRALRLVQKREDILATAAFGEGVVAQDHHVSPVHPEYAEVPTPEYDPEQARALLEEAGYPDGIEVTVTIGGDFPATVAYAETVKAGAEEAGIQVNIEPLPGAEYWNVWTEAPLAITEWGHRALGTMVLNLAYSVDEEGNPADWNESHWVDEEFNELLQQANGTVDVEERRELMEELETIQQERGTAGIAYWRNVWRIVANYVHGVPTSPEQDDHCHEAWIDPAAQENW